MNVTIREKDSGFQAIVSYKQNGKWKQKSKQGFKLRKDAKNWANEMQYLIMEDKKDGIDTNEMTIEDALNIYLEYKKKSVKFTTYNSIKTNLQLLKPLSDKVVSTIKPIEISLFIANLRERTGYSYNNFLKHLKTFFIFCIKDLKIIREIPINIKEKKNNDIRKKYISKDLYQEILNNTNNEVLKLFISILYGTGMRISEVYGLKQEDIKDCIITVKRQRYKGVETTLKTDNGYRQIPIKPSLYREIKEYNLIGIDGFIFKKRISIEHYLKQFNVSPHCFRHTYATDLVAKGINLKVASEILGDKLDTFIKVYVQSSKEEQEKAFYFLINEN